MRKKDKKKFYGTVLMALLLLIGLGYAYLSSNLQINGDALFKRSTWSIQWVSPPTVSAGSVSGASVTTAAHVTGTNNDTVEYSVTLTNPRDYYEFTVTAENTGTMDGMISVFSNKVYSGNTEITLPDYVKSEISYTNGARVKEKQLLAANSTQTFKVKVSFRDDIEVNQLPGADTALSFRFNVTYVQADNTAIQVVAPAFNEATPWEDVINGIRDGVITPTVGDTKKVILSIDLDNDNEPEDHEYTLRVANTSTPAECSSDGFSETACGLVLEFADVITTHVMNSTATNVGGWPASEMRTYINSDIYNALPEGLKNAIIDTTVVSGHGSTSGETNFISTDKLYFLSTKEVWGKEGTSNVTNYDSAETETRQLDYYVGQNVITSSYSRASKNYNESNSGWWLRSAHSLYPHFFFVVSIYGNWGCSNALDAIGVSPAFRIA